MEDDDADAETASRVGLNPEGLSPEEEGLLPPGAQENLYVQVRCVRYCQLGSATGV